MAYGAAHRRRPPCLVLGFADAARGGGRFRRLRAVAAAAAIAALFAATIAWGIASRDNLLWKHELVASFFRPEGFAFEPTARRHAVAERDAVLRAAYPHQVPTARRKHVVLIIVDSLRADRMQVYGYPRPTTPFPVELVQSGRMKKVDAAFSSCSESFCGITSTLASREFRDISARTFQLQDVLRDQGYQTWFLLSGNHRAWNGLPSFYHASDEHVLRRIADTSLHDGRRPPRARRARARAAGLTRPARRSSTCT